MTDIRNQPPPWLRRRFERALQTAMNFTGQSAGSPKVLLEINDVQYLLKWMDAPATAPHEPPADAEQQAREFAEGLTAQLFEVEGFGDYTNNQQREGVYELIKRMLELYATALAAAAPGVDEARADKLERILRDAVGSIKVNDAGDPISRACPWTVEWFHPARNLLSLKRGETFTATEESTEYVRGFEAGTAFAQSVAEDRAAQRPSIGEAEVAEIEARCNAASEGPWRIESGEFCIHIVGNGLDTSCLLHGNRYNDAKFIAHARTDIPKLIAALRGQAAALPTDEAGN